LQNKSNLFPRKASDFSLYFGEKSAENLLASPKISEKVFTLGEKSAENLLASPKISEKWIYKVKSQRFFTDKFTPHSRTTTTIISYKQCFCGGALKTSLQ